ncbi:Anaphase-promoting complex subunit 8 [Tolypocladium ophioglossoides CBS 100239]|uniref:Anaphase-promoting complex subunit 8 n=1 Tax=Tolypocladium ophioglossoides (strain CBS 100239) TaxID=1163406 RepID=A0A0L0MYF9_TOLOC|nr:Anaphase-promoting complex subunit 8 [Tolypocladium ophioglossoides CBS 100239]
MNFNVQTIQPSRSNTSPDEGDSLAFIKKGISQKGLFLALYALLMAGEKLKTEQLRHVLGSLDIGAIVNKQLVPVNHTLGIWFETAQNEAPLRGASHGWLEYLFRPSTSKHRSRYLLVFEEYYVIPLELGYMAGAKQPNPLHLLYILSTKVTTGFSVPCSRTFLAPEYLPWQFISTRITSFSTLSYKREARFYRPTLSAVDRYRPETCYVIGNYYSLSKRHEDAVGFFRRALILDRSFSGAWTLLGHKYVQLQNTHAAVECYRRAIDLDQHDHRSFVGLGQSYEALGKPTFALYYYRRAIKLRLRDVDLWQSVSDYLIGLSLLPEAIKALESSITRIGPSPNDLKNHPTFSSYTWCKRVELIYQLAKVYEATERRQTATRFLELCVELSGTDETTLRNLGQSLVPQAQLLLAQWAMDDGDFVKAQAMADQVDIDCEFAGAARNILQICSRRES